MKLKSMQYSQYDGQLREWQLEDCTLGDKNLIVGKNATGKTRTLNVIWNFARVLSDERRKLSDGNFRAIFDDNGTEIRYVLTYEAKVIKREELTQDDKTLLKRESDGTGRIWADELNQEIKFQPFQNLPSVLTRRDAIQHPFLDKFYNWGKSVIHFRFGTRMGQDQAAVFVSGSEDIELQIGDKNPTVAAFKDGKDRFGDEYVQLITADMGKIGYDLEDVTLQPIGQITENDNIRPIYGLQLKEKDLNVPTQHQEISAGMFRTLSLLVQLNYSVLATLPSCIIIDDIGEGLDYTRSTALIDLLINKVEGTDMQLIMSTNDRFVMNAVPLEYWSVIQRFPNKSKIYNYRNSKKLFDEFEFTGLNNFDFFSSNYFLTGDGINEKDRSFRRGPG